LTERWRDVTGVWTPDTQTASLQDALLRGRAWFFDLSQYRGELDLRAGGYIPMGSAGVVDTDTTTLEILATGVPDGWRIVVISGVADQPGSGELDPLVTNQSYAPRELTNQVLTVTVPSVGPSFHRVALRDSYGLVHAYSNPVWVFREPPSRRISKRRWAKPPTA
jgi:hypothetical protein